MASSDAEQIASGHAWAKHKAEFPECATVSEFAEHIDHVLTNPTATKKLAKGRQAFWHSKSKTIVILDPTSNDKGTAFRPSGGKAYFDNLK